MLRNLTEVRKISDIKKKAWPELFEAVLNGKKNFDLRLDDFQIKDGDILILEEWDPRLKDYTGRTIRKKISFVLHTKDMVFWNDEEIADHGFVVMGFDNAS